MKLRYRFGLVGGGIIVFLIVTPILILYARGFKFDWATKKIVQTGSLVVRSQPTKAQVTLETSPQRTSTTPATIRFIRPGDYNVTIAKDGYQSWTKRLSIKPQFVTWANDNRDFVTLFLTQAQLQDSQDIVQARASADGGEIALLDSQNNLTILNANSGKSNQLKGLPVGLNLSGISWTDGATVYQTLSSLAAASPDLWTQLTQADRIWANDNHLAFSQAGGLYVAAAGTAAQLETGYSCAALADDGLWYIAGTNLKHYAFNAATPEILSSQLPPISSCQIIRAGNQLYVIADDTLSVFNAALEKIYSPVTFAQFDAGSNTLLYGNDNELEIYTPARHSSELLLRSITPITDAVLNQQTGYVLFANDGKIKAAELDGRDHRNIYTLLATKPDFADFAVSADGTQLYTINQSSLDRYRIR